MFYLPQAEIFSPQSSRLCRRFRYWWVGNDRYYFVEKGDQSSIRKHNILLLKRYSLRWNHYAVKSIYKLAAFGPGLLLLAILRSAAPLIGAIHEKFSQNRTPLRYDEVPSETDKQMLAEMGSICLLGGWSLYLL